MNNQTQNCGWEIHWFFRGVGAVLALVGGILTASIIGAIIGIPMLLIASPLLKTPVVPVAWV